MAFFVRFRFTVWRIMATRLRTWWLVDLVPYETVWGFSYDTVKDFIWWHANLVACLKNDRNAENWKCQGRSFFDFSVCCQKVSRVNQRDPPEFSEKFWTPLNLPYKMPPSISYSTDVLCCSRTFKQDTDGLHHVKMSCAKDLHWSAIRYRECLDLRIYQRTRAENES